MLTNITNYRNTSGTITPAAVSTTATQIVGWNIYNPGSADAFVKLYDKTVANTTAGTTIPIETLHVPAQGSIVQENNGNKQFSFLTACTISVASGVADTSSTAPSAAILIHIKHQPA